jgi:hypothetical protein
VGIGGCSAHGRPVELRNSRPRLRASPTRSVGLVCGACRSPTVRPWLLRRVHLTVPRAAVHRFRSNQPALDDWFEFRQSPVAPLPYVVPPPDTERSGPLPDPRLTTKCGQSYAPIRDAFARVTRPSWAARQSDRLRAPS